MKLCCMLYNHIEMFMMSGIYVWTKIVEIMAGTFQHNLVSCVVHNSSLRTWRIVVKLNGVLDYYIGICIFSEIYVCTKIVEMTTVKTSTFFSKTWSDVLSSVMQYCNETWWNVRLSYGFVHILLLCFQQKQYWMLVGIWVV